MPRTIDDFPESHRSRGGLDPAPMAEKKHRLALPPKRLDNDIGKASPSCKLLSDTSISLAYASESRVSCRYIGRDENFVLVAAAHAATLRPTASRSASRSSETCWYKRFGWRRTEEKLRRLGASPVLREGRDGGPYLTDGGHYILERTFHGIADAGELGDLLDRTVGVVEHGLFIGITSQVVIGTPAGVRIL